MYNTLTYYTVGKLSDGVKREVRGFRNKLGWGLVCIPATIDTLTAKPRKKPK